MHKKIRLCRLAPPALVLMFCVLTIPAFAQQSDKTILLKGVKALPLPDSPNIVTVTMVINRAPQIIATAKSTAQSTTQLNVITTSHLQKGRIAVFGSSAYLKMPLLNNSNVQQLVVNTVGWADRKKSKNVQIWGKSDLQKLLTRHGYHIIASTKHSIVKSTSVIILTEDVKDSVELKRLETFTRQGGALIVGSALTDDGNYELYLNSVLTKAGLYQVYDPINVVNNQLITGDTPPYLHITTILQAIENKSYTSWTKGQLSNATAPLFFALYLDTLNSPEVTEIKKLFHLDDGVPIIPSPQKPVVKTDWQNYIAYQMQRISKGRQLETKPDPTYIDPASKIFPGTVADTAVRINTKVTIPVQVGDEGVWEPDPLYFRWHSTGLYVPPGEKITITINDKDSLQHLKAQIGVHNDNLMYHEEYTRTPEDLTKTFELNKPATTVYSPFGGILLINIPDTCTLKTISIQVNGAVKEPYFKLGVTSVADWKNAIRNYGAPWAELVSDKIILDFPSYRIRNLDDPEKVSEFWDEVMDTDAKLADLPPGRKHPERLIVDQEVAAGYLFTDSYKIVLADDEYTANMLDEVKSRRDGTWGIFHELGHRHQFAGMDFEGTGEVTVNLFTMYVYDKLLHKGIYNSESIPDKQTVIANIKKYMADKPSFAKWQQDPFLALSMYIEIIEGFGWQPIEDVFKYYRTIPRAQYPKEQADKRDMWFLQISKATKRNMAPFFDKWLIPITDKAKKQVSNYPEWLPDELK